MLRGSVGCDSADFLKLTEAERRKCAAWRRANVDPDLRLPPAIDPVKQAWFDASLQKRKLAQAGGVPQRGYTPRGLVGKCGGGGGAPPDSVKIGPCSVGVPGMFNDDDVPPP